MALEDSDIAAIAVLLSPERLAALTALTGSTRMAVELHQATLSLNAELMNVIASIELALRNTVSENLTAFFGVPGWLIRPVAPFQWKQIENNLVKKALDSARRAEYSKMTQAQKGALDALAYPSGRPPNTSHLKRAVDRRKQIHVSDGKIIAETTMYFWKRLYSSDYEQSLWRTTLKRTFPNKSLKRAQVADKIEDIYQARNRLAHHEPVLHKRFRDTITGIEFVTNNLSAATPSNTTPLAKLIADDLKSVKDKATALHDRLAAFRNP
ncbi:MAG: hypothetical protein ACK50Q_09320 [Labrys sp. (in: a-proteobacteria)]|jgi:hypothetical protein